MLAKKSILFPQFSPQFGKTVVSYIPPWACLKAPLSWCSAVQPCPGTASSSGWKRRLLSLSVNEAALAMTHTHAGCISTPPEKKPWKCDVYSCHIVYSTFMLKLHTLASFVSKSNSYSGSVPCLAHAKIYLQLFNSSTLLAQPFWQLWHLLCRLSLIGLQLRLQGLAQTKWWKFFITTNALTFCFWSILLKCVGRIK